MLLQELLIISVATFSSMHVLHPSASGKPPVVVSSIDAPPVVPKLKKTPAQQIPRKYSTRTCPSRILTRSCPYTNPAHLPPAAENPLNVVGKCDGGRRPPARPTRQEASAAPAPPGSATVVADAETKSALIVRVQAAGSHRCDNDMASLPGLRRQARRRSTPLLGDCHHKIFRARLVVLRKNFERVFFYI